MASFFVCPNENQYPSHHLAHCSVAAALEIHHLRDPPWHAPRAGGDNITIAPTYHNCAFQSTPPVRGATPHARRDADCDRDISIHAPRAGGDNGLCSRACRRGISIHAPRAGGDDGSISFTLRQLYFNPRPPCGGRREGRHGSQGRYGHFNPRPPCGGRPLLTLCSLFAFRFQSTPPVRGATVKFRIFIRIFKWFLYGYSFLAAPSSLL